MIVKAMRVRSFAMALCFTAPFALADTLPVSAGGLSPNAAADLLFQLETLQQEVQHLRGKLEEQEYELNKMKQQQRDRYIDLDKRISLVMANASKNPQPAVQSTPAVAATPATSQPTVNATPTNVTPLIAPIKLEPTSAEAKTAYSSAYGLIRQKQYEAAHAAFIQFVADYPNNALTGNGYYWLGELKLVLGDQQGSLNDFKTVVQKFSGHSKEADAIYKLGIVNDQLGSTADAKQYLQDVIRRFPNTNSAKLATKYLAGLK